MSAERRPVIRNCCKQETNPSASASVSTGRAGRIEMCSTRVQKDFRRIVIRLRPEAALLNQPGLLLSLLLYCTAEITVLT